jgi:hypothetical protein
MTPQERDLLTNLVSRLRQSPPQQTDPEAEAMINDLVGEKPDTSYILAQTVLIQDYALHQAQDRVADLERQLLGQAPKKSGGFLSAIFGDNQPPRQPQYQQPTYAPQPVYTQPAAGPWGGGSAQPSFLRSAATTAAGIAGGALLFQGIESLFGGHGGFGGGFGGGGFGGAGFMQQPGITETVVNNYYDGTGAGEPGHGGHDAAFDQGGNFDQSSNVSDASFDDSGFGGDSSFDGGDNSV